MKRIFAGFCGLLFIGQACAAGLVNFTDITQQLSNGHSISLTTDLTKCKIDDPNDIKMPLSKWYTKATTVIYNDDMVSVDAVKYASGRPPLPANGLIQRASVFISSSGDTQITISFFDAETNKKWMKDVKVSCRLNEGVHVFSQM